MDLQQVIFDMQMQDYQPVLAHPERYTYLNRKRDLLDDLKAAGCLFQLNLLSLTGYYGDTVLELAEDMVHNNYYDMVGTDLHHHKHLEMLQKLGASPLYQQLRTNAILRNKVL
ncbi:MAG TPA: CpsB/CapC family capsule biosynthesis tyrosine phosphatase, partial [Chitinophagaceae bacterium]|nr:CpsB/CapC family capsule biosynthesis tyrosine phosphatase [Chitinophagaceae bacterium]